MGVMKKTIELLVGRKRYVVSQTSVQSGEPAFAHAKERNSRKPGTLAWLYQLASIVALL